EIQIVMIAAESHSQRQETLVQAPRTAREPERDSEAGSSPPFMTRLTPLDPNAIDLLDDLARLARVKQHRPRLAGRRHPRTPARAHARQWQRDVLRRIADDGLRIAAPGDHGRLLEHALAQQDHAAIALPQMLLRAVGD